MFFLRIALLALLVFLVGCSTRPAVFPSSAQPADPTPQQIERWKQQRLLVAHHRAQISLAEAKNDRRFRALPAEVRAAIDDSYFLPPMPEVVFVEPLRPLLPYKSAEARYERWRHKQRMAHSTVPGVVVDSERATMMLDGAERYGAFLPPDKLQFPKWPNLETGTHEFLHYWLDCQGFPLDWQRDHPWVFAELW